MSEKIKAVKLNENNSKKVIVFFRNDWYITLITLSEFHFYAITSQLTLSVLVIYQHPTSPYITHTFVNEKMRIDQTKQTSQD